MSLIRTRWAAIGAAVAVTLGGGGIALVSATSPADATTFVAITPCRVIDTRPEFNVGPKASPLGPGETHTVATHGDNGDCTGIPSDAVAVSMNMTAVGATAPTFLTVWAAGAPQPTASSMNPTPGAPPTPNAITTELNGAGEFDIFNLAGNVHVLADINGYYVDHHHDDRYYTKGQSDDRYYTKAQSDSRYPTQQQSDDRYYTKQQTYDREAVRALDGERVAVSPASFIPRFPAATTYEVGSGGQLAVLGGTSDSMLAHVDLPHGATITSIIPTVWDDATANLAVRLVRVERITPTYENIFSLTTSTNSPSSFIFEDDTPIAGREVVDNVNFSYVVVIEVPSAQWSAVGYDIRFQHMLITYDL